MIPHINPAIVLLVLSLPIAIWVAWSDMKFMKIPNKAVLTMAAVWVLVGWPLYGLHAWGWGFVLMAIVLAIGFVMNAINAIGAGDAKFAAAMAPMFTGADWRMVAGLYCACLLGAVAVHRIMRSIPAIRRATPDWQSWGRRDFPMGLALTGTLIFYLLAAVWSQA